MKSELIQDRARKYLSKMEPSISGQGGHDKLFSAAVALVQGFAMEPEQAAELLFSEFNQRCIPPWNINEIQHKVESALKDYDGRKERGYLLSGTSFVDITPPPPVKKSMKQETPKRVTRFYRQDRADGYFWRMNRETIFPDGKSFWSSYYWNGFRYEVKKNHTTGNNPVIEDWLHLYDDGDGAPYMLVHRLKFADGRKMTPLYHYEKADGRYIAGAGGLPRIPYNALMLKEARFVRICEGEKAADALSAYLYEQGILTVDNACTTFGGAKVFNADMADWFIGKNVLIYSDNDDTGRLSAKRISDGLKDKARSVQIIERWADGFPEKGDITDWINNCKEARQ